MLLELEDRKIDEDIQCMPNQETLEAIMEIERFKKYGDTSGVTVYDSVDDMFFGL